MTYRLKELRARHDLSQAAIAKKLGVSTLTYLNWEKDPKKIPMGKMVQIAQTLQVDITDVQI